MGTYCPGSCVRSTSEHKWSLRFSKRRSCLSGLFLWQLLFTVSLPHLPEVRIETDDTSFRYGLVWEHLRLVTLCVFPSEVSANVWLPAYCGTGCNPVYGACSDTASSLARSVSVRTSTRSSTSIRSPPLSHQTPVLHLHLLLLLPLRSLQTLDVAISTGRQVDSVV